MTISKQQQETLADIFSNTERPDKISIKYDVLSKTIVVTYEDIDEQWFYELVNNT